MPWNELALAAVAGLVVGALISWLIGRLKGRVELTALRGELERKIASTESSLNDREARLAMVENHESVMHDRYEQLLQLWQAEAVGRAKAEEAAAAVAPLRQEMEDAEAERDDLQEQLHDLRIRHRELEMTILAERDATESKLALLRDAESQLGSAFKALSADALHSNNQAFVEMARETLAKYQEGARGDLEKRQQAIDQIVQPVRESLDKVDARMGEIEKERVGAYEGLLQQVRHLADHHLRLQQTTANLTQALGTPRVRGRWGEIQLKRVVELAGMLDHCDFQEQPSTTGDEPRLRPDLIVRLPGGKQIVVDAKAPLAAYLEAIEEHDETVRRRKMQQHARQIRDHAGQLSRKQYWAQFQPSPEFVVLFLPNESFFSAALQEDPALIEHGVEQRVILATPTTLITLLKAVSYGWREERMAANAREIADLGKALYKRIGDVGNHLNETGERLGKAVEAYNRAIGSLENRVMVTARKFRDLEVGKEQDELKDLSVIEAMPRIMKHEG